MSSKKVHHGLYSTKTRFPKATGMGLIMQKGEDKPQLTPVGYISHPDPYASTNFNPTRDAYKGTQIMTRAERGDAGQYIGKREYFSDLTYHHEPFIDGLNGNTDEDSRVEIPRFLGDRDHDDPDKRSAPFGSSRPIGRDDLCSTIQVGRYRHQLGLEHKHIRVPDENIELPETRLQTIRRTTGKLAETGLMSTIPQFETQYDRQRHVDEFRTRKYDPEVKYTREYGTMVPASADIGEGCDDISRLVSPALGMKKSFTHSNGHLSVNILNRTLV